jgi:hypothetical protein
MLGGSKPESGRVAAFLVFFPQPTYSADDLDPGFDFFFHFFFGDSDNGNHPRKERAKFGYRSERKVGIF